MIGTTTIEQVLQGAGDALKDHDGNVSSMRVMVSLWAFILCAGVAWIVYSTKVFPDLPQSIVEVTAAMVFGKVWQKGQELK